MSSSNCCFLTCIQISQEAGQVVWYSHLLKNFPQFIVIHTVKCFGVVNKAEIDVFLELSCFFHDPADVGNLISGSSSFSKTNWNIWKFTVHILLKPGLENFEHYFTSVGLLLWLSWYRTCLQCGRPRFNPWVGKIPGEGKGYPLQSSCLENPRDGGAWWAAIYGVAQSWTRLKRRNSSSSMENSAVATGLKRSVFIQILKKNNAKECSNYCTNCTHVTC